jgi:O-antigen/teichoic acid export membrane protein
LLARLLGPQEFGVFGIALFVMGMLIPVVADPTANAVKRLFSAHEVSGLEEPLEKAGVGLALFLTVGTIGIGAVIATWLFSAGKVATAYLVLVTVTASALFGTFQYLLTLHYVRERTAQTVRIQVTHAVAKPVGLACGALVVSTAGGAMAGYLCALCLLVAALLPSALRRSGSLIATDSWYTLARYGVPLIAVSLSWVVLAGLDRTLLAGFVGEAAAGRYAFTYLLAEGAVVVGALALEYAIFPRVARLWESDNRAEAQRVVSRAVDVFLIIALPVAVGGAIFGSSFVTWIGGSGFHVPSAAPALICVGLILFRLAMFDAISFQLSIATGALARSFLLATVMAVPITVVAILLWEELGAAVATMVSYMLLWVVVRSTQPRRSIRPYPALRLTYAGVLGIALGVAAARLPDAMAVVVTFGVLPAALAILFIRPIVRD